MKTDTRGIFLWMTVVAVLIGAAVLLRRSEDNGARETVIHGRTMGTTYNVRVAGIRLGRRSRHRLETRLAARLLDVNRRMSIFMPQSDISRFNRAQTTRPISVSPQMVLVTRFALDLARRTGGAFDPTVAPLVNLWGFGRDGRRRDVPAADALERARRRVGWRHLTVWPPDRIQKDMPQVELDLGALAKGYAVDSVADLLRREGFNDFLIEIGGEVFAQGVNAGGEEWTVGVEWPSSDSLPGEKLSCVIHVSGWAVATSGDYRNFYRDSSGSVRTHIIDPRTGYPVSNRIASVTVIARKCMVADALATAVFVLGEARGMDLVETRPRIEALIIEHGRQGFTQKMSSGFRRFLARDSGKGKGL